MISSGMKRGLAATAVSALAVAGLPFLASSASAATGDSIAVGSVGPIRNGNADGGSIVLKTKGIDPTKLKVANTALNGSPNSPSQSVTLVSASAVVANGADGDSDKTDGLDEITVKVAVTTPAVGDTATFAFYEDEDTTGPTIDVDANEARTQASVTTTGAPTAVDISSAQPASVAGAPITFAVAVTDAGGHATQLVDGESIAVTNGPSGAAGSTSDTSLTKGDLPGGKGSFTAAWYAGGTKTITVAGAGDIANTVTDSQSVTIYDNANITKDEFALATGADNWVDGTTDFGADGVQVRVDQNSVTFNFASKDSDDEGTAPDDAGKAVVLTLASSTIKFDGAAGPKTAYTLLDSNGKGSITVALSNVTRNSTFTFAGVTGSGISSTTVTMADAAAETASADKSVYVTKVGSPTSVVVTVKDQFGNPIGAPAQVAIVRSGRTGNAGTTARTTVNASGQATFSLPDAGTGVGTEDFDIALYADQYAADELDTFDGGTINYTADGLGGDFTLTNTTGVSITPVYDGHGDSTTDAKTITITGGTVGTTATVSVDGGALLLGADDTLAKATASKTIVLDGTDTFTVVGTKFGVVTATVTVEGRSHSVQLTVKAPADAEDVVDTARNVELEGPAKAEAGEVSTFTATVTDAFGNPVPGVSALDFQVGGPASGQPSTSDTATDANGEFEYDVLLTDNANSKVTVRVTGYGSQFGKAANSVDVANDAPGISASSAVDTVEVTDVVNIAALQKAVDDAQAKVDAAEDVLAGAQGDLSVAKAQQKSKQSAVNRAQGDVNDAQKALNKAKKKHKGVKSAKKTLKVAKRVLADAKGELSVANAAVTSAQTKVDNAQTRLDKANEELAAAEAALEEAQG